MFLARYPLCSSRRSGSFSNPADQLCANSQNRRIRKSLKLNVQISKDNFHEWICQRYYIPLYSDSPAVQFLLVSFWQTVVPRILPFGEQRRKSDHRLLSRLPSGWTHPDRHLHGRRKERLQSRRQVRKFFQNRNLDPRRHWISSCRPFINVIQKC